MKQSWLYSVSYALQGILEAFNSERNLRIHFSVALLALLAAVICQINYLELALVIFAIGLVIVAELLNTAIEKTIDLFQPTYHPLAKTAKNVAAGAVLVAAFTSVMIGILVFGPYLLSMYSEIFM